MVELELEPELEVLRLQRVEPVRALRLGVRAEVGVVLVQARLLGGAASQPAPVGWSVQPKEFSGSWFVHH